MATIKQTTNNLVNNSKKFINNISDYANRTHRRLRIFRLRRVYPACHEAIKFMEEHNVMNKIGGWFFALTTFFLGMTCFGISLKILFDADITTTPIWSGAGMLMMIFCCLLYPVCKKVYHMMKNADD